LLIDARAADHAPRLRRLPSLRLAALLAVVLALVALSACTSSTSGTANSKSGCGSGCSSSVGVESQATSSAVAPRSPSVAPHLPHPRGSATTTYATQTDAVAAACLAFEHFYSDLVRLTPKGPQQTLVNAAAKVLVPLDRAEAGSLTGPGQQLRTDAIALLAHVGSTSWPTHGTTIDAQVIAVQRDCNSH
jgi:hypothetical protein